MTVAVQIVSVQTGVRQTGRRVTTVRSLAMR